MSCCGGNRAAQRSSYQVSSTTLRRNPSSGVSAIAGPSPKTVNFEYSGSTAMTVAGPATGTIYRFSRNGMRLSVHGTDAPSFLAVPGLRPVR